MGAAVGKSKGAIAGINITPLVDVVLVLLIIFMVASQGDVGYLPNAVPKPADIEESAASISEQLVLEIFSDNTVFLNRMPYTREEFEKRFVELMKTRADKKLYLGAEDEVPYRIVIDWMSRAKALGASTVALQIRPPEKIQADGSVPTPTQ